jgi:hypothetical protein
MTVVYEKMLHLHNRQMSARKYLLQHCNGLEKQGSVVGMGQPPSNFENALALRVRVDRSHSCAICHYAQVRKPIVSAPCELLSEASEIPQLRIIQ